MIKAISIGLAPALAERLPIFDSHLH